MKQLNYIKALEVELRLQGKAKRTIETYCSLAAGFVSQYPSPARATIAQIKDYVIAPANKQTQKQVRAALVQLYRCVLKQPGKVANIPNPRQNQYLPQILSLQQVRQVVKNTNNLKHFTLLSLSYSAALRVSELCELPLCRVDLVAGELHITGKGSKDRIVPINAKMCNLLRKYIAAYEPSHFLFEGTDGAYTSTSAQKVLQAAANKAGIRFRPTIHTLRHCRATHLLNSGLDVHVLSGFMGHYRIDTTQKYLHLSQNAVRQHISKADLQSL